MLLQYCIITMLLLYVFMSGNIKGVDVKKSNRESSETKHAESETCGQLSSDYLKSIHGPAFNNRYMAVENPVQKKRHRIVRNHSIIIDTPDFSVREHFSRVLSDQPAWNFTDDKDNDFSIMPEDDKKKSETKVTANRGHVRKRHKRQLLEKHKPPWCRSVQKWIDLGSEYYPRYLRTIECSSKRCYFNDMYYCVPRAFTVKVLRKIPGSCASQGSENHLVDLWVWEEKAITFCCECSAEPE